MEKKDDSVEPIKPCGDDRADDGEEESGWQFRLPTELWFRIVCLLPYASRARLACTCRRLEAIVSDRRLWRIIRLDRYQHLTDAGLAAIGRKQPQQLHLTYCRGVGVTYRGNFTFRPTPNDDLLWQVSYVTTMMCCM